VAVVQISRIQVRRGRKGQTDIPQLASGELGWAIDTQELYIGNGAVSEGAPAVGNTKILTAADNIFDLSDQYELRKDTSYIQTGAVARTPVNVTLQERLDYETFAANFGAVHDETIIQTAALQRAIDNLFLNTKTSPENRFVLNIGPGIYRIDDSLKLPPYTTLKGAGIDKTIIEQTTNNPIFITVNGASTIGSYDETVLLTASNQAQALDISGMTLRYENTSPKIFNTAMILQSSHNGYFHDLRIKGYWDGDGVQANSKGIELRSFSGAVRSRNNRFERIEIEGFCYGVDSSYDIENNAFMYTNFQTCLVGVRLGYNMPAVDYNDPADLADKLGQGEAYGPHNTLIQNSSFREIFNEGVIVNKGKGNISQNNKYYDVGNDGGSGSTPVSSIIKLDQTGNNTIGDWFQRTTELSYNQDYVNVNTNNSINYQADIDGPKYLPEVEGYFNYDHDYTHTIDAVGTSGNWITGFRLPANQSRSFTINYQYRSDEINGTREGQLKVIIDKENDEISVTDEFEFIGLTQSVAENLTFRGRLVNITSGNVADTTVETAYIEMKNGTTSDTGEIQFRIASKS
jgi:hypothetical protein